MPVDYRKRPAASTSSLPRDAARVLGALHSSRLRYERAHRELNLAQDNNRDGMRKAVRVPWAEFFGALRTLDDAVGDVLTVFNVK